MANSPISGSTNAADVSKELQAQLAAMRKNLKSQMMRALTTLEAEILKNIRSASGLNVRTGALLNSVGSTKQVIIGSDGTVTGQIGSEGIPYNAIHEFGGIVKAVNKQFLAIPTEENRKADGSPIVTTGELRTMQKLGLAFIAKGTIFQKASSGKDALATPMFLLRKSVTIPARPYLRPALVAKQAQIMSDFGIFIKAAFPPSGDSP